jgi:hypothetical protein
MITPELIEYIKVHQKKNISKEIIISKLIAAGWYKADIEEGFQKLAPIVAPAPVVPPAPVIPLIVQSVVATPPVELKKFTYTIPQSAQQVRQAPPVTFMPPAPLSVKIPTSGTMAQNAMLSTYASALSSVQQVKEKVSTKKKSSFTPWLILFFVVFAIGGIAYANFAGYVKIPFLNSVSIIKKDPKAILLGAPATLNALKSYKTETNITLSFPSLADISNELSSGEPTNGTVRDSISVHVPGMIDKSNSLKPQYNYMATITSTLLKDGLVTKFVYDGKTSFVTVPSLSQILGDNAPASTIVSVPNGQFGLIVPVLRQDIKDLIATFDTNNIISNGLSANLSTQVGQAIRTFIASADIVSKDDTMINGASTYHYQVNANTDNVRHLIGSLSDTFLTRLPTDKKVATNDVLGGVRVDAFEFWVGKSDNTIYQYKMTLSIPLSKVIGIEDKGIVGNVVTLSSQTRFYDINVPNTIVMPQTTVPIEEYAKRITDMKIKNASLAFKTSAQNFRNTLGNYGKGNVTGSCTKPVSGSLFSPVSHSKAATLVVGDIATDINTIIDFEGDTAVCYSSPSAWAIALPLASDLNTTYCTDSAGVTTTLATPLAGTVCK